MSRRDTYGVALRVVLWAILGARVVHVVEFGSFYSEVPFQTFYLWQGGLSLWGALIGGGGAALWHARRRGVAIGRFADALAVAGLAVMASGRIGDLIGGERPGTPTSLPWGVAYANERARAYLGGVEAHPVAFYELLLALSALGVVLWLRNGRRRTLAPDGAAFVLAMAVYAVGRFFISFVRDAPEGFGLQQAQWIALAVLAAAALYAWRMVLAARALK
jgi:prolipoprotein diacylglyceryltransferase